MAEGGIEDPCSQVTDKEEEMIHFLESTGKFEIRTLRVHNVKEELHTSSSSNNVGRNYSSHLPKIPQFSGTTTISKGEISYPEWRFEINCLLNDPEMTESLIFQAIRSSLRGTARKMLLPMGEKATVEQIMTKLDSLYGETSSHEMLMQEFFNLSQNDDESVTDYGCRLELALQSAIENGYLACKERDCHLRHQLWHGLHSERLKDQTHHKFDSVRTYDQLLKEIRVVERGLTNTKSKARKVQHHAVVTADKVSELEKRMDEKLGKLEERIEKRMDTKFEQVLSRLDSLAMPSHQTQQGNFRNSQFQGPRNNFRGNRYQGRGQTSNWKPNYARSGHNSGNNPKV